MEQEFLHFSQDFLRLAPFEDAGLDFVVTQFPGDEIKHSYLMIPDDGSDDTDTNDKQHLVNC